MTTRKEELDPRLVALQELIREILSTPASTQKKPSGTAAKTRQKTALRR